MKPPKDADPEDIYRFEERAGIHQDSHAKKAEAEQMAWNEVWGEKQKELL